MDASIKHRIIGSILVVAIALIVSPFFIKESKPSWIVLEDRKSFKIPPHPKSIKVSTYKPNPIYTSKVKEITIVDNDKLIEKSVKNAQLDFNNQQNNLIEKTQLAKAKQTKEPNLLFAKAQLSKFKELNNKGKSKGLKRKSHLISKTYYSLQLATFSSSNRANILLNKLKEQGIDAYLNHIQAKSGKSYTLVMAGHIADKEQVKRLQKKLDSSIQVKSLIIKYG